MADFSHVHPIELANKVKEMRTAQQKYLDCKTSLYLAKSKALEKEVDDMLAKIHGVEQPQQGPSQTSMFG